MTVSLPAHAASMAAPEVAEQSAPSTRFADLLLQYSEGLTPFGLWLPPEEEWETPAPVGLWARLRYWFKRLAAAKLGNDDD
jgi:hypothetical protein